jgi:hypothetical protein
VSNYPPAIPIHLHELVIIRPEVDVDLARLLSSAQRNRALGIATHHHRLNRINGLM